MFFKGWYPNLQSSTLRYVAVILALIAIIIHAVPVKYITINLMLLAVIMHLSKLKPPLCRFNAMHAFILVLALLAVIVVHVAADPVVDNPNVGSSLTNQQLQNNLLDQSRAIVTSDENTNRQVPTDFNIEYKPYFGLFVQGAKTVVVSDSTAQAITLSISLPDDNERQKALEIIGNILDALNAQKAHSVLLSGHTPAYRKKAINTNIANAVTRVMNMKQNIEVINSYLIQPNSVHLTSEPSTFSKFCVSSTKFQLVLKLSKILELMKSFDDNFREDESSGRRKRATTAAPLGKAAILRLSQTLSEQILLTLNRLEKLENEAGKLIKVLEALSNYEVNAYTRILLQKNTCIPDGALETTQLKECVIIASRVVCSLQVSKAGKTEQGFQMIPVVYPTFRSGLSGTFIRRETKSSQYADVSKCLRRGNVYHCTNVNWVFNTCIAFDQASSIEMLFQHCNLVKTVRKGVQVTQAHEGVLVHELGPQTKVLLEKKHKLQQEVLLIPYTYSFRVSVRAEGQIVEAKLPFEAKPILISWFGKKQIEQINKRLSPPPDDHWYDFLDEEEYKIYGFLVQVLGTPVLLKALWTVAKKEFFKRFRRIQNKRQTMKERLQRQKEEDERNVTFTREANRRSKRNNLRAPHSTEEEISLAPH